MKYPQMYVFISQFEYIRFYPTSMTIILEYVNVKCKMKKRIFSYRAQSLKLRNARNLSYRKSAVFLFLIIYVTHVTENKTYFQLQHFFWVYV